jgi:hypothetical protein
MRVSSQSVMHPLISLGHLFLRGVPFFYIDGDGDFNTGRGADHEKRVACGTLADLQMVGSTFHAMSPEPSADGPINALRLELKFPKQEFQSQQVIHEELTQICKQFEEIKGLVQG